MKEQKKIHFAWLDALRFIAAFLVLFCHSRNDFFLKPKIRNYHPIHD